MTINQVDGNIPSQVYQYFQGQILPLDEYYLVKTGDYSYRGVIQRLGKEYIYVFERDSAQYSSYYTVSIVEESANINISNPIYCYSSVGTLGVRLETPMLDKMASFGFIFITCLVALWVMFRSVIFKCFGIRKKR